MRQIYECLGLSGFDRFAPKLQGYVDSLAGYQKNAFGDLDEGLRRRVSKEWARSFDEWKYPQRQPRK